MSLGKLIYKQYFNDIEIHVYEKSSIRYLTFGDNAIQSAIDLSQPGKLQLPIQRAFFSPLIFTSTPNNILLLGVGGGSVLHYLSHIKPEIKCDAVELHQEIINIAEKYFTPANTSPGINNHKIINDDAKQFIFNVKQTYDLIIFDITHQQFTPEWTFSESYLTQLDSLLSTQGALVINTLAKNETTFMAMAGNARQIFKQRTAFMSIPDHKNIVLIALKQKLDQPNTDIIQLSKGWRIQFGEFYDRLKKENPTGSGIF